MRPLALVLFVLLLGGCVTDPYASEDPYGSGYPQQAESDYRGYGDYQRDRDHDRDRWRGRDGERYYEDRGRREYRGPAKEHFAECAGLPTAHRKDGEWEYWVYAPDRNPRRMSRYEHGERGQYGRGYCEALLTIRKGRVLDIQYRDGRGRMLDRNAGCFPALEACLRSVPVR